MARDKPASTERAEISVRSYGLVYFGERVLHRLGLEKNDQVRATVPLPNGETETVKGFIDSSNHICVSKKVCERLAGGFDGETTVHVDALVEPGCLRWEDIHGLTENRWDGHYTLDIEG